MKQKYSAAANALALITIFYNIAEGLVSVWFGLKDETFALFGFGLSGPLNENKNHFL
jgi:hypothetical protein